jgi:hypothetical protein
MKKKHILLTSVLMIIALSGLQAQIINIEIGGGTSLGTSDVAGIEASAGWQKKSGFPNFTNSTLNLSDGSSSGATITGVGSGNITTFGASTSDNNYTMFNSGLGIEGIDNGGTSLAISGLGTDFTTSGYDVYVYFGSALNFATNDPYTLSFSDGSTTYYAEVEEDVATYTGTFSRAASTVSGSPTTSSNYVLFEGLSSANFTITAGNIDNVTTDSSGAITGMQIVAIPEPSTLVLVGLALGSLLFFRRRKV